MDLPFASGRTAIGYQATSDTSLELSSGYIHRSLRWIVNETMVLGAPPAPATFRAHMNLPLTCLCLGGDPLWLWLGANL